MTQRQRVNRAGGGSRGGFTVVEVLVAMIVMSVAMLGIAGMLAQSARLATGVSARSTRGAIEAQLMNRLASLPYDAIDGQAGCVTVTTAPMAYTRCIAVTSVGGGTGAKQVRLIVAPINSTVRADTTYLTRSQGAPPNPLAQ